MSAPQVPPRPVHSKNYDSRSHPSAIDVPKVPPRPQRRAERSQSPMHDTFARSPLNQTTYAGAEDDGGSFYQHNATSGSSLGVPQRPPSVTLPSIGQEGNEYADAADDEPLGETRSTSTAPEQRRTVDNDLPLHAPKPSFTTSNAKARIAHVTRTDSTQAAAVGIGKASTPLPSDDKDPHSRSLHAKDSFTGSTTSTERPGSIHDNEHGIPEIGQRVPMYPNAGDVQAPSPAVSSQVFPSGIGFHNDGTHKRHHGRTRSGREVFSGPPGSYGLHGHGVAHKDQFEKAWYDKHPEAGLREEQGQYGPSLSAGRAEWALSSEDLNKIVHETASRGAGLGTSPNVAGLPNEQIGYIASEEYASRMTSPRPQSATFNKAHSNISQTLLESPLGKASLSNESDAVEGSGLANDSAVPPTPASGADGGKDIEEDVIHVDPPEHRIDKMTGDGEGDLGPHGGNTANEGGWIEERGYGVPILASDEVAKEPGSEFMQPAVSPVQERRGSGYQIGADADLPSSYQAVLRASASSSRQGSRPGSRPASVHGPTHSNLSRFASHDDREDPHTPLENVEEYEPLFPDDDDHEKDLSAPKNAADRFKQRQEIKRRFPSQDIWEDTPNSLQLQATVQTPEPAEDTTSKAKASTTSEIPETEATRKGVAGEEDRSWLLSREERLARSQLRPHLQDDTHRAGMPHRFPSQDIWEDSPASARLETTVERSQADEGFNRVDGLEAGAVVKTVGLPPYAESQEQTTTEATRGPELPARPDVPRRPAKSKQSDEAAEGTTLNVPTLPARPSQKPRQGNAINLLPPSEADAANATALQKSPSLPDRPKPQIPARPNRPIKQFSGDEVPLAKTQSAGSGNGESSSIKGSVTPPAPPKPKPALPARPVGGKIAAMKAGFLSDLDKRLQLGPQSSPKSQEKAVDESPEGEKAPLADARKGRAKGPTRRKPAASPGGKASPAESVFTIAQPWTVWQIMTDGTVHVGASEEVLPTPQHHVASEEAEQPKEPAETEGPALSDSHVVQNQQDDKIATSKSHFSSDSKAAVSAESGISQEEATALDTNQSAESATSSKPSQIISDVQTMEPPAEAASEASKKMTSLEQGVETKGIAETDDAGSSHHEALSHAIPTEAEAVETEKQD